MKRKGIFSLVAISFAMVLGAVGALRFSRGGEIKEAKAAPSSMKVAGSWTNWATNAVDMTLDGDYYTFTRDFAVNDEFKVIMNGNVWVGAGDEGASYPSGITNSSGNFKVTTADKYTVRAVKNLDEYGNKGYGVSVIKYVSPDAVYSIRINEGGYENMVKNNSSEFKTSTAVSLNVGDMIYFQKDGDDLPVAPKDDDSLTRVVADGNALRVVQAVNDYLYLNITTNKLWAGQYTYPAGNYLLGAFNSWGIKESVALPIASMTFAANAEMKAVSLTANQKTINDATDWIDVDSVVSHPNGAVIKDNGNAKVVTAGTYSVSVADGVYTFTKSDYEPSYKLLVGENELTLEPHEGNEWKVEDVDLTQGTHISYKLDGVEVADSIAKVVSNNNLTNSKNVVVDAENVDIYVDVVEKTIWVGGLPTGGFHLIVNGDTLVELSHTSDFDGYTQYGRDGVTFAVNDTIEYINCGLDASLPVIFHEVALNAGGLGSNFQIVADILTCKTACTVEVYLKLSSGGNEIYLGAEREEIALAREYASGFLTAMGTACKAAAGYEGVVQSDVVTAWNAQASAYAALAGEVKTELQKGDASTAEEVRQFAEAYEGIFLRRGAEWSLDEFMEWGIVPSNYVKPFIAETNNQLLLVIALVSALTISGAGLFFFLKKRKESK